MKYQLVLQWSGSSFGDYDTLIEIEGRLIEQLPNDSEVDGHDIGSDEANIFILTDFPVRDFACAQEALPVELHPTRAAFREAEGEQYVVLWPNGEEDFSIT